MCRYELNYGHYEEEGGKGVYGPGLDVTAPDAEPPVGPKGEAPPGMLIVDCYKAQTVVLSVTPFPVCIKAWISWREREGDKWGAWKTQVTDETGKAKSLVVEGVQAGKR